MNIGALPELLLSLFKSQGAEQLQAGKDQALNQFKPGAQYEGKVLDSLPNGRNLVQVGNQAMDMALPRQAQPGDVIRLTFLNAAPRPTFALSAPATVSTQPVNVSPAAQQVNALVRYIPVSASAPLPGVSVAVAATVASATPGTPAAQAAALPGAVPAAPAVTTARPIVANPAVLLAPAPTVTGPISALPGGAIPAMSMAGEAVESMRSALGSQSSLVTAQGVAAEKAAVSHVLPMRLQQTVKESGLFYESHLGKWARGELSLESIQREPQARLLQSPGPLLDLPDLEGMPEQAARLASRQLHMLEGGPFLWQGQAWPGQTAEWQVQERKGGDADGGEDGQKWHSRLRLTLPRLGDVSAELDIGAQGLRIRLHSGSPETLAEINAAMPELAQRMRDADLKLSSIQADLADA